MTPPGSLPAPKELAALRPRDLMGLAHVLLGAAALGCGLALAATGTLAAYALGQMLLAFAFVHAFALLHEAGHKTLFRSPWANRAVGHCAGFVALIPFVCWKRIHARHHRWTGWQDLDSTTASLVPREVGGVERAVIDFAWRAWLPLFSTVYRVQNYWNLRRIAPFVADAAAMRRMRWNVVLVLGLYAGLVLLVGPLSLLHRVGPGLLLALAVEDLLILSQHTHVPMRISHGAGVQPFTPREQITFTRSLRLPAWISAAWLHLDAHGLHHMYPRVPGYLLADVPWRPADEVHWLVWLRAAKGLSGTTFLFANRDQTGASL